MKEKKFFFQIFFSFFFLSRQQKYNIFSFFFFSSNICFYLYLFISFVFCFSFFVFCIALFPFLIIYCLLLFANKINFLKKHTNCKLLWRGCQLALDMDVSWFCLAHWLSLQAGYYHNLFKTFSHIASALYIILIKKKAFKIYIQYLIML